MPKQTFRNDFKLYIEGIEVPFKHATITATPGGTQASIGIYSNKDAHGILPKCSVQVFFKEWIPSKAGEWKLLFDGFISATMENDVSLQGRMMSIQARDFVADANKIPASIAYDNEEDTSNQVDYHTAGLHRMIYTTSGNNYTNRTYHAEEDNSGIQGVQTMVARIAGAAQGGKSEGGKFSAVYTYDKDDKLEGGLFLDAFARGIWVEAIGGTSIAPFLNSRLRVDKKMIIPSNTAGYNMYSSNQTEGIDVGGYMLGTSKYTSVMASIMRLSSIFSVRMFSTTSPSLINLSDEKAREHVIEKRVKKFIVDDNKDTFGAPFILNTMMLLPSLEFTSPPSCNMILPTMYHNLNWTIDHDRDYTRGDYKQANLFENGVPGDTVRATNIQVPSNLYTTNGKDEHNRSRLKMTLEERVKGINQQYGHVDYMHAEKSSKVNFRKNVLSTPIQNELNKRVAELENELTEFGDMNGGSVVEKQYNTFLKNRLKIKRNAAALKNKINKKENAVRRHALIRFINEKYSGRVLQVDMMFNPYIMAGFPTIIIAGKDNGDSTEIDDIVGQVQQVQHRINISSSSAEMSTSVVVNGSRFVNDPTDMDEEGNPIYAKATNTKMSEVDYSTFEFKKKTGFYVEDAIPRVKTVADGPYDIKKSTNEMIDAEYRYAKDFLTLTSEDAARGEADDKYLDSKYLPNAIPKFYRDVFGLENNMMIGGDKKFSYAFDTVHEASEHFKAKSAFIYDNYEESIEYIHRDICGIDDFYRNIMGASIKNIRRVGPKVITEYLGFEDSDIDNSVAKDRYYGVSTKNYAKIDKKLKKYRVVNGVKVPTGSGGLMEGDGGFSSLTELKPITCFSMEHRESIESYLGSIKTEANYVEVK